MAKVRILDDLVVNQIAAGEVVERPASVVKELVENSIDAHATEVSVVISQGGQSLIEVIDNGEGMTKADALTAIERFGTSKISSVDDLIHIATHGFRGEALPSIASVSRFTLRTRHVEEQAGQGVEISIVGGKLQQVTEMPLARGTRISVQSLFFNVPARRRFLKSDKTEAALIKAQIQDFAAAYPSVKFKLLSDGSEILSLSSADTFEQRLEQLKYGEQGYFLINRIQHNVEGDIAVAGMLTEPLGAVVSSSKLRLLVNGRSVRDKIVLKAVRDGFGSMIKPGRYPAGIVKLDLPPEDVDVNVHPQKAEVRFRAPEKIYQALIRAVANSLSAIEPHVYGALNTPVYSQAVTSSPVRPQEELPRPVFYAPAAMAQNHATVSFQASADEVLSELEPIAYSVATPLSLYEPVHREEQKEFSVLSNLRYVGQVLGCFILLEGNDSLVILDMHAAHERATFYRLKKQFLEGSIKQQSLLFAERVILDDEVLETIAEAEQILTRLGFAIKRDNNELIVEAVPAVLARTNLNEMLRDLLSLPSWQSWETILETRLDEVLSRIACHGSVRSGRQLERDEVYALLQLLDDAERAAFCPHGRPVAKTITHRELEAMFGRIQN